MSLTAHQLLDILDRLESAATSLREASTAPTVNVEGLPDNTVLASALGLTGVADDLDTVVSTLRQLIPDGIVRLRSARRLTRVLVKIFAMKPASGEAVVSIPEWDPDEVVKIEVPADVVKAATSKRKSRFYAYVNLEAETASQLRFDDWQIERVPAAQK